jgi:hypothetical protein
MKSEEGLKGNTFTNIGLLTHNNVSSKVDQGSAG